MRFTFVLSLMKQLHTMKKPTIATVKSFIKKNRQNLYINVRSSFDAMVDSVIPQDEGFSKVSETGRESNAEHDFGIRCAWFVGNSRDYISVYDQDGFSGYRIVNSCGTFILAVKTETQQPEVVDQNHITVLVVTEHGDMGTSYMSYNVSSPVSKEYEPGDIELFRMLIIGVYNQFSQGMVTARYDWELTEMERQNDMV